MYDFNSYGYGHDEKINTKHNVKSVCFFLLLLVFLLVLVFFRFFWGEGAFFF